MSKQERELDAAEYVIGTLSAVERKAFEASLVNDSKAKKDVAFWQRAFGALNASVSPEKPPKAMWKRIEGALANVENSDEASNSGSQSPVAANDNMLARMQKSRGRWRMGAMAATIAALSLGVFIAQDRVTGGLSGKEFIAVVNANGDQPSLVVNVNAATGEVTVRSIGVNRPDGKSLELWYVPEGQKAVSVGLVGEGGIDLRDITAKGGDLLAISLEPQGGSPTGTATGPVIYTGKLIENIDAR